jgi:tRNA-intron endonuclease
MPEKIEAELLDNFLIVWNPEEGSNLYKMGYYGKPIGIAKPKIPEFDVPLILDIMEGVYLVETKKISVFQEAPDHKQVSSSKLRKKARKLYENFDAKYTVYRDLRGQKLIVTPGMKFGCDFAVYQHGPGIDHAPYMISVRKASEEMTATDVVKAGRLATTVRKRFIVAIPDLEAEAVRYLIFKWFKA